MEILLVIFLALIGTFFVIIILDLFARALVEFQEYFFERRGYLLNEPSRFKCLMMKIFNFREG